MIIINQRLSEWLNQMLDKLLTQVSVSMFMARRRSSSTIVPEAAALFTCAKSIMDQ